MKYTTGLRLFVPFLQQWSPKGDKVNHRFCSKLISIPSKEKSRVDQFKTQLSTGPNFKDFVKGASVYPKPVGDFDDRYEADGHANQSEKGNSRKGVCYLLFRGGKMYFQQQSSL